MSMFPSIPPPEGGPSKVVHIRSLGNDVLKDDIRQLCAPFGPIRNIVHMQQRNQALVEFEDVNSAIGFVTTYSSIQPRIKNRNVYVRYSVNQQLNSVQHDGDTNHILLVRINASTYGFTVNVDILHAIFSPYGVVHKIVITTKNIATKGLQALVKFMDPSQAEAAKRALDGVPLFGGSVTFDITYSNLSDLTVHSNNELTRDFLNMMLPNSRPIMRDTGPALMSSFDGPSGGGGYDSMGGYGGGMGGYGQDMMQQQQGWGGMDPTQMAAYQAYYQQYAAQMQSAGYGGYEGHAGHSGQHSGHGQPGHTASPPPQPATAATAPRPTSSSSSVDAAAVHTAAMQAARAAESGDSKEHDEHKGEKKEKEKEKEKREERHEEKREKDEKHEKEEKREDREDRDRHKEKKHEEEKGKGDHGRDDDKESKKDSS